MSRSLSCSTGLENIPRITELREIRSQAHAPPRRESLRQQVTGNARDDMIVLPVKMQREQEPARPSARDVVRNQEPLPSPEDQLPRASMRKEPAVAETVPRPAERSRSHARILPDQAPPMKPHAVEGGHLPAGGKTLHARTADADTAGMNKPPQHRRIVTHTTEVPGQHMSAAGPHTHREAHGENSGFTGKKPHG